MIKVLILGAGGHGQVVADILFRAKKSGMNYEPIGFLDDDPFIVGKIIMGLPVLGNIDQLDKFDNDAVIISIGDNRTRARIFDLTRAQGKNIINAIHPNSVLAYDVRLGEGVMICAGVVVNTGTEIGANVILNTGCTVDHHNRIENHVHIAPGAHLGGNVIVEEGAFIGIGASVLPGRKIGAWSVIGAGSVVTQDVPSYVIAAGIPAKVIKYCEP